MPSRNERVETRSRLGAPCFGVVLAVGFVLLINSAAGQYGGYGYSYAPPRPAPAAPRGPNLAGGLSTYSVNPYGGSAPRPSGLPLSKGTSYFGSGVSSGSFGSRPAQKPFSNLQQPRPLMSSMDAARVELTRTLWYY